MTTMVPSARQCYELMEAYAMLANIRAHSILVARIAERLAGDLLAAGHRLSVEQVVAGALLHDIAKTPCLESGCDHARRGREICLRHRFAEIADIVGEHVVLADGGRSDGCSEKEIVYYADKRVNHESVVTLDDRLDYILSAYGNGDPQRCRAIRDNFAHCHRVEAKLFAVLPYGPADIVTLIDERPPRFALPAAAAGG